MMVKQWHSASLAYAIHHRIMVDSRLDAAANLPFLAYAQCFEGSQSAAENLDVLTAISAAGGLEISDELCLRLGPRHIKNPVNSHRSDSYDRIHIGNGVRVPHPTVEQIRKIASYDVNRIGSYEAILEAAGSDPKNPYAFQTAEQQTQFKKKLYDQLNET